MRTYVSVIVVAGFGTITQSLFDILRDPKGWDWTLLAILTLVSGSATCSAPRITPATISVSETFVFTSVSLFGPAAGTLIVALDAFIISFWAYKKGDPLYKIVFNVCALPLTIWLAAHLFFIAAGIRPLVDGGVDCCDPKSAPTAAGVHTCLFRPEQLDHYLRDRSRETPLADEDLARQFCLVVAELFGSLLRSGMAGQLYEGPRLPSAPRGDRPTANRPLFHLLDVHGASGRR